MMKIKKIFDKLKVTQADVDRLGSYLKSWAYLNEAFLLTDMEIRDLEVLITLEASNRNRPQMLKKLIGKRNTAIREALYEQLGIEG